MKVVFRNDGHNIPYGFWVVCPTVHMNNWMYGINEDWSYNENMWQVDKEGYDKCEVITWTDIAVKKFCCCALRLLTAILSFWHMLLSKLS